jgi:malate dehydrogenase (oxaloacetate-decarboxylating)(NADP+)
MIRAKKSPKRVVFAEADNVRILRAAEGSLNEKIAKPILLGKEEVIRKMMEDNNINIPDAVIIDPRKEDQKRADYGAKFFEKRGRKGVTSYEAEYQMRNRNYFGSMMVETGDADVFISGLTRNYPLALKPALFSIGMSKDSGRIAGMHIMMTKQGPLFFADTTVNVELSEDELYSLVKLVHKRVKDFQIEPKIAMLSYSNFGSNSGKSPEKIRKVVSKLHQTDPEILVDGEMQPIYALDGEQRAELYPFNKLGSSSANTFIFPDLDSANAAYQILRTMGMAEAIGPVLLGMNKTVHILHHSSNVREIMNMVALGVCEAQSRQ